MKNKKITALMLSAAMAVTAVLSGCGGGGNTTDNSSNNGSSATTTTTAAAATTAANTDAAPAAPAETKEQPTETLSADALTYASGTTLRTACGTTATRPV